MDLSTLTTYTDPDLIDHLPSNLSSLSIYASSNCEHWPTLPDSLTELAWFRDDTEVLITYEHLQLPPKLKLLHVEDWQRVWFHLIPRTVTSLSILRLDHTPNAPDKPDYFRQLPNSLTALSIATKTWINLSDTSLAHLCRLTSLNSPYMCIPSSVIHALPRNMTSLTVSIWPLDPRDLRFLPLALKTVIYALIGALLD